MMKEKNYNENNALNEEKLPILLIMEFIWI